MKLWILAMTLLAGAIVPVVGHADDNQSPAELVKQKATATLDAVASQREELRKHPKELYSLVEDKLLPVFDFDFTARLVLGRHWRDASSEQQEAFRKAFVDFLIHNYANGLLKYQNNKIDFEPVRGSADPRHTIVQTKVYLDDGTAVPVDYVLHRTKQGDWKIFDVVIEGISYVNNYRQQFGAEVDQKGLDELISRLQKESRDALQRAEAGDLSVKPAGDGKGG